MLRRSVERVPYSVKIQARRKIFLAGSSIESAAKGLGQAGRSRALSISSVGRQINRG